VEGSRRDFGQGCPTPDERRQGEHYGHGTSASMSLAGISLGTNGPNGFTPAEIDWVDQNLDQARSNVDAVMKARIEDAENKPQEGEKGKGTSRKNPFSQFIGGISDAAVNLFNFYDEKAVSTDKMFVDENDTVHPRTCFTAGTKIKTQSGYKSIEDIQTGNIVASANEHTGKISYKRVVQTFIRQAPRIYKLTYNNGTTVKTTGDHPFFIQGKGWTDAESLSKGDISPTWAGLKKSEDVVEKEIVFSNSEDMVSQRVSGLVLNESLAVVDIEVIERGAAVVIDFFDNFGANIRKITSKALSGFGEITGLYKDADATNSATKSSPEVELMLAEALDAEKQRATRTFKAENAAAMRAFKDEKMKMNALMSKVNLNNLEEVNMELVKLGNVQNEFGILSNDVFLIKRINDLKAIKESQKNIVEYKERLENATNSYVNTMSITIHNLRPVLSQQFDKEWTAITNFGKSYKNLG
jgi:hypothetical protein